MDNECLNWVDCAAGGIGDVINGGGEVLGFFQDPWGKTFEAMRDASKSLANDLLPALTSATLPDLSVDWFLSAYAVSFATAILVMVVILLMQLVRTARGQQSGRALAESLGLYTPLFLGGAMFGPLIGLLLVNFFHSLSSVFMSWGITGSIDDTISGFQTMLDEADPVGMAGGVPVAAILMILMLIGLLLVLCILIVQLVALYFMGVIVPLGIVWIIDENHRRFGLRHRPLGRHPRRPPAAVPAAGGRVPDDGFERQHLRQQRLSAVPCRARRRRDCAVHRRVLPAVVEELRTCDPAGHGRQ
ncbi:hypothetical protein NVV95_17885 [Herbiconiux sp. CPCC 205716]|uniref:Type IV secretion system protein n=1 Tax=Herbiconiux gentiana TaxID=2970912 RepID=A0ABT2GJY2_9MICO|nr:hypothetical protein [Herbiconiux gentiana]MCS5716421.1 hypothetical protein [Herbiconiux gentiana]